jgi:glycosyltransferase involved in cell wall biosynthesis
MKLPPTSPRQLILLNPYHKGSHAAFADSLAEMLQADGEWQVQTWTLPGAHWKWRMQGAAAHFARQLADVSEPDVILTTDMCDVSRLRGLLPAPLREVPIVMYCHENQLTFPWSAGDPDLAQRIDLTYGMTNVMSALASDQIWFNSHFHLRTFIAAAQDLMRKMPDAHVDLSHFEENARVMHLPLPLQKQFGAGETLALDRPLGRPVRILWNHRWSMDKGIDRFLRFLEDLAAEGIDFELILLGVGANHAASPWLESFNKWNLCILHQGQLDNLADYGHWLQQADILVHDPRQEFFGISVVEAMWHGVLPILPPSGPYPEYVPAKMLTKLPIERIREWHDLSPAQIESMRREVSAIVTQFCHTSQQNIWTKQLVNLCTRCPQNGS